jgi:hypothetical protein
MTNCQDFFSRHRRHALLRAAACLAIAWYIGAIPGKKRVALAGAPPKLDMLAVSYCVLTASAAL